MSFLIAACLLFPLLPLLSEGEGKQGKEELQCIRGDEVFFASTCPALKGIECPSAIVLWTESKKGGRGEGKGGRKGGQEQEGKSKGKGAREEGAGRSEEEGKGREEGGEGTREGGKGGRREEERKGRKGRKEEEGKGNLLASFPGSGNTWTRHLLEQSTGILTGSMYCDPELQREFKGECLSLPAHSFSAVKTHVPLFVPPSLQGNLPLLHREYGRAVVVVRDPYQALLAEYQRVVSQQHTVQIPEEAFQGEQWLHFALKACRAYEEFHSFWRNEYKGKVLFVLFANLRRNLHRELRRILDFLQMERRFEGCHWADPDGKFRRRGSRAEDYMKYYPDPLAHIMDLHCVASYKALVAELEHEGLI